MAYSSCSNRMGSGRSGGDNHGASLTRIHTHLSVDGQLPRAQFRFGLTGKMEHLTTENGAPNNASSQTKNYEIAPFILVTEGSYHSSLFSCFSRSGVIYKDFRV
ncbi:hypothetical protein C4D60_Mb00t17590 [Musa balbisiana]|uniref:Uncharacterized protein n=1 Tax=Musa balbisiana TaxID=52838 RepID=A0A4S8I6Y1_MUSBA|nr:hypothetical protein C4D60_Mb00t17590 [Musa balbisiana]